MVYPDGFVPSQPEDNPSAVTPKALINATAYNIQLLWDAKAGATAYYLNGTTRATDPSAYIMYGHIINKDAACKISFTIEAETSGTRETWIEAKDIVNIIVDETKQPDVSIIGQEDGSYKFVANNGYTGLYSFQVLDPEGNLISSNNVKAGATTTVAAPSEGCTFNVREVSWPVGTGQENLDVTFSAFKSFGFTPYDFSSVTTEVHNQDELVAALNKGGTVILMNDIDGTYFTVSSGGDVILDLNGYTITLTSSASFSAGKTATIVDNSEAKTGKILNGNVSVVQGCNVRFEAGEYTRIYASGAGSVYLGDISVANTVSLTDTKVIIEGGSYGGIALSGCKDAHIAGASTVLENGSTLFLTNGTNAVVENCEITGKANIDQSTAIFRNATLTGDSNVVYVYGADASLSVESGNYTCNTSYGKLFYVSGGTLTISGGTFNQDPSAYVSAGHTATDNGDGTWTVA